jgi:hypothetical protein
MTQILGGFLLAAQVLYECYRLVLQTKFYWELAEWFNSRVPA